MAYLGQTNFQRNRSFLLGEDEGPEYDLSDDYRTAPTLGRGASGATQTIAPPEQQTIAPVVTTQPAAPSAQTLAPEAPSAPSSTEAPSLASYTRQGSLSERLFKPVETAAEAGQESLTQAGSLFSEQAGPSRSYESTGAEETLASAYQGGLAEDMERAREFVGARYEGPQGLEQGAVAGLQKLTGDLRTRQRALSTGGGLQTLISQSVGGLTPGEALFEARRELPQAKLQARDLGFTQISPLEARLAQERQGALDFASQRTAEEEDIAARSEGYLEGERGGITGVIEALMAERTGQQGAAEQALAAIQGEEDPGARLAAIQSAAPYLRTGTIEEPGEVTGAAAGELFNTQAMQDKAAADALFAQIMGRPEYASIAERDPLELGITARGKGGYDIGGEDIRSVVDDPAMRQLLYERQRELEASFDPARGQARVTSRTPAEESVSSQLKPLYYGEEFEAVDQRAYLGFDPGVRPSRENTSSEVQREQFNRINDLLGELDRISEAGETFRAAQIFADADRYLADEEAALEKIPGKLSEANQEWRAQVKKLRKSYRKKKREQKYAQIATIIIGPEAGPAIGKSLA